MKDEMEAVISDNTEDSVPREGCMKVWRVALPALFC